ncbi:MAG: beta-ketoacyl synthase N-terminal-like domain-containing protein [Acidimicrobiales bacterium]
MSDVVIVEAVRSPIGRRNGGLSTVHPVDLLAEMQQEVIRRSGIDPSVIGQVVTGCVSQIGEQSFNVGRTAWLSAGLPKQVAATTVDTQCGSSQQATNMATALVKAGVVDVALACGVEVMSRVPIGSNSSKKLGYVHAKSCRRYEFTAVRGAERVADKWHVTRPMPMPRGLRSPVRRPGLGRGSSPPRCTRSAPSTSTMRASPPAPRHTG